MDLKKSIYNVIIDEMSDNRKLIYNTYSGIFGILDKKSQYIFDNIENYNTHDVQSDKNINVMLRAGYITDSANNELAKVKYDRMYGRYTKNIISLTIAPTMDCNMSCSYCYEKRNKSIMKEETQEQIYTYVKSIFNTKPHVLGLSVTWYGGEPLMQKEIICNLSKKFIDLCNEQKNNIPPLL